MLLCQCSGHFQRPYYAPGLLLAELELWREEEVVADREGSPGARGGRALPGGVRRS